MSTESENTVAIGIPPEEGKFCADCKHLLGVRDNKDDAEHWNCAHPNNSKWKPADLVTGIKQREFKFNIRELRYRSTVDSAAADVGVCGPEGKWYEKYERPTHNWVEDDKGKRTAVPVQEYKPATMKPSALKNLTLGKDL